MKHTLQDRYRASNFHMLFNMKNDMAKGRVSMLASAAIVQAMVPLTSGVFYTGFLIANDIDIVGAGIISFIPYIASFFSLFSPYLLERFPRRRGILLWTRLVYYIINILGVTALPLLITDTKLKIIGFSVIIFLSGALNALTSPGFTPWHLPFIPDAVRVDYFGYSQVVRCTVSSVTLLASGFIADALKGTASETGVLYFLRLAAFFMALVEVGFLAIPQENPYEKKEPPKLRNVFLLSFHEKKFFFVVLIVAVWTCFAILCASSFNYYLINTAKVPYSYITLMDSVYPLFLFAFSGYWRKFLRTHSWLRTFAYTAFMYTPSLLFGAFINHNNYLVLMTLVRFSQHLSGVGLNHSFSNLPFINLPETDRTNYIAFYSIVVNVFALIGTLLGTWYIAAAKDTSFALFGVNMTAPQQLLILQGIGQTLTAAAIFIFNKRLEPDAPSAS